jgi:DNA-binding IclR family transcriptional regulator
MLHVDVLLLLWRSAPEPRTASAVTADLGNPQGPTLRCLEDMVNAGLVRRRPGDGPLAPVSYSYAPATTALDAAVHHLASVFLRRPVTLVRTVYDRPALPDVPTAASATRDEEPESEG